MYKTSFSLTLKHFKIYLILSFEKHKLYLNKTLKIIYYKIVKN